MSLLQLFSLNKAAREIDDYSFHFSSWLITGDIVNIIYLAARIFCNSQPFIALQMGALEVRLQQTF